MTVKWRNNYDGYCTQLEHLNASVVIARDSHINNRPEYLVKVTREIDGYKVTSTRHKTRLLKEAKELAVNYKFDDIEHDGQMFYEGSAVGNPYHIEKKNTWTAFLPIGILVISKENKYSAKFFWKDLEYLNNILRFSDNYLSVNLEDSFEDAIQEVLELPKIIVQKMENWLSAAKDRINTTDI